MESTQGVLQALKGRSLTLDERLRLLLYAWRSPTLTFPNKQQVLIDLLSRYLLNRKKHELSEADASKIWKCLHDVLQTNTVHVPAKLGQGLSIKHSIVQVLLDALSGLSATDTNETLSSVIGCCQAIVTSPMLSYILVARLDHMLTLLASLCRLLTTHRDDETMSVAMATLVHDVAAKYVKAQKTAHNQRQLLMLTCDKLLPDLVMAWSAYRGATAGSLATVAADLHHIVEQSLFHRDHHGSYCAYLGVAGDNEETRLSKKPKTADHIFSSLAKLLSQPITVKETCAYLPMLFDGFLNTNCHGDNGSVAQRMFVKLVAVMSVPAPAPTQADDKTDPGVQVEPPTTTLSGSCSTLLVASTVRKLLEIAQKYLIYSAANDAADGTKQLQFYRHLVRVLLANRCLTSDWYQCFTILLKMNHQILETSLPTILTALWIDVPDQLPRDVYAALDGFLCELLTTYDKLRQVTRLVSRCLDSLSASRARVRLLMPPAMLSRYGDIVQLLPQATTTDIWQKFITHLKERYVTSGDFKVSGHLQGPCTLFYHYLLNVKVTDYSTTSVTSTLVQQLMVAMETDILVPLLTTDTPDNTLLCAALQLSHGWGRVAVMLSVYTPYRAGVSFTPGASKGLPADLSLLHGYLDNRGWKAVYKTVLAAHDSKLLYGWDLLTAQRLRAIVSLCPDSGQEELQSVLDRFMELPDIDAVQPHCSWNGSMDSVTNENYPIARCHLIVSSLAYLHRAMSRSQIRNVARLLVKTSRLPTSKDGNETTLREIAQDALTSKWFRELAALHTEVVSCLWGDVRETLYSDIHSPKKRKTSLPVSLVREILDMLSTRTDHSTEATDSIQDLQQMAGKLCELLEQTTNGETSLAPGYMNLTSTLELLQHLPLEHMAPVDQIRCMVGLLTLLSTLSHHKLAECGRLMSKCVGYILVLMETSGSASFFHLIDVPVYLHWLRALPDSGKSIHRGELYHKILLLTEMSCSAIVRDFSLLEKLPAVVDKLCFALIPERSVSQGAVLQALFILQECQRLLRRPYLNESLKSVYASVLCTLSSAVMPCLPLVTLNCDLHFAAHVVRCSAIILDASTTGGAKADDIALLLDSFPVLFEWCVGVLTHEKQREVTFTDVGTMYSQTALVLMIGVCQYHRMAALAFLHTTAKQHTLLADVFTSNLRLNLWTTLYDWLQKFLSDQSEVCSKDERTMEVDESVMNVCSEDKKPTNSEDKLTDELVEQPLKNNHSTSVKLVMSVIRGKHDSLCDSKFSEPVTVRTNEFSKMAAESPGMSQQFSSVSSLYKALVFEGAFECERSKVILNQVQAVMATLVLSYDVDEFSHVVNQLVNDVCPVTMATSVGKLQSAIYVWRHLLRLSFTQDQAHVMVTATQNMMLSSLNVLQQLQHKRDPATITAVAVPVVMAQVQMITLGPSLMCPQTAIMSLYSCQHVPLDVGVRVYVPAFNAISDLLDALLIHHTDTVFQNISAFISAAKHLLLSVMDQSSQDKIADDKDVTQQLIGCAYQMERLFSLVSTHKVEFGKVAIYVVSDYVTRVQRATLLPAVKRALVPAVYKMLDLCDIHAIAQLRTVLSHGVCQVFQLLHDDYTRYHKYTGKV